MNSYPRKSWHEHLRSLKWKQGEHMIICAPTGAGKTTMVQEVAQKRSHSVMFVSKMNDPTIVKEFKGWTRYQSWPKDGAPVWDKQILLWPKPEKTLRDTLTKQREVFEDALNKIAREGNRCVIIDESLMMNDPKLIGLATEIGALHYYGRSAGISMVDLTQRPSWIPKVIYSSVAHAYVARTTDDMDAKRLSDLGSVDSREVGWNLKVLPDKHDYIYLNPHGDSKPVVVNTRK